MALPKRCGLAPDGRGGPEGRGEQSDYLQAQTVPGALYYYDEFQTFLTEERDLEPKYPPLRQAGGQWPLIPLGTFTRGQLTLGETTVNYQQRTKPRPNGTATFLAEDGIVLVGDVLVARRVVDGQEQDWDGALDTGDPGPLLLGRVVTVGPTVVIGMTATQEVTVHFMPVRLAMTLRAAPADFGLALYIAYFPRIHPPTFGDINLAFSTTKINNVQTSPLDLLGTPFVNLSTGWARGQRIFNERIVLGAYIDDIDEANGIIEVSREFTAGLPERARLQDATVAGVQVVPLRSTLFSSF